jgi:iron complex outermembrane receptor protein
MADRSLDHQNTVAGDGSNAAVSPGVPRPLSAGTAAPRRRLLPVLMSAFALSLAGSIAPCAAQEAPQAAPTDTEGTAPLATIPVAGEPPAPISEARQGGADDVQLEEIVVTAQKRSEVLSKVPLAISAFDEKAMEKVGSASLYDSTTLVPNLQNSTGGFAIRGVGTTAITSTSPTVAIHVDGVYSDDDPRGLASLTNWDVARVEVLRGPQGTLYGRNATAGVINIITAKPSEEFEAFGDVSYRDGNEKLARIVVNQPITDTLALRLAGGYLRSDGWQINTVPGESNGQAADAIFGRLSLRWRPLDSVLWDVNLEYLQDDTIEASFQEDWYASKPDKQTAILYPSGLSPKQIPPQGSDADQFGSFADRNRFGARTQLLRSALHFNIDEQWTLNWIEGWRYAVSDGNNNSLPLALVDHSLRGNNSESEALTQSHELDLNFEGDSSHGVLGLYYFRKRTLDNDVLHIWTPTGSSDASDPPQLSASADLARQAFDPDYNQSLAAFTQVTFDVTEALRLTGGLRYNRDKMELGAGRSTLCQFGDFSSPDQAEPLSCQLLDLSGLFGGVFGPTELPPAHQSWNKLSWKATVDYDITRDLLSYATVSTGYKQGSIAGRDADGTHVVKPESNTNYEVGLRWQLFDNRANLNVTAFWMNYTDLQVNTSETIGGAPTLTFANVGSARSRGVEAELTAKLTANDRIDGYVTYLDAVITHWPDAPDPLRGAAFTFDAAGNRLPGAPESTFRLSYSHAFDLGDWGKLVPTLASYHSSESFAQYTNGPQDRNPAYWRSDVFIRYATLREGFTVEAFVNNIEDVQTKASVFAYLTEATGPGENPTNPLGGPGGGIQWAAYNPGRIWGVRLGARF